ncbi:hypothetical protein [Methanospirillum hungatei]|uniref:hypothetical protein n=1 Tax=Methanospirillum hungatei TaxID=2203 RepID=UPI0026EE2559|nr:hypothetical protein [Methanospirillum hungatei]MCA1914882.1 hypothetical protein [Methanospirillum hungatei]
MTTIAHCDDGIQYVLDASGKKTAVIVPIELWDKLKEEKITAEQESPFSVKKYRGILKGKGISGRDEEIKMRDEWD